MMGKASFRRSRLLVGLPQAAFTTDQLPFTCRTAAFVYHNFLSEAECNHLVKLGTQRVRWRASLALDSAATSNGHMLHAPASAAQATLHTCFVCLAC